MGWLIIRLNWSRCLLRVIFWAGDALVEIIINTVRYGPLFINISELFNSNGPSHLESFIYEMGQIMSSSLAGSLDQKLIGNWYGLGYI